MFGHRTLPIDVVFSARPDLTGQATFRHVEYGSTAVVFGAWVDRPDGTAAFRFWPVDFRPVGWRDRLWMWWTGSSTPRGRWAYPVEPERERETT